jgi:2-phospho-L-lactate guanylyltransferase
MLMNTLGTLNEIPEIESILVVSRDGAALSLARDFGARTIQENGSPGLNLALARATILAKTYATRGVLILPADLPLITKEDIQLLMSKISDDPVVVVVPDRHKDGTNALIICPSGLIEYEFGPGSFERHCQRVKDAGARLVVCELSSLALDLDQPDDLVEIELKLRMGYDG